MREKNIQQLPPKFQYLNRIWLVWHEECRKWHLSCLIDIFAEKLYPAQCSDSDRSKEELYNTMLFAKNTIYGHWHCDILQWKNNNDAIVN